MFRTCGWGFTSKDIYYNEEDKCGHCVLLLQDTFLGDIPSQSPNLKEGYDNFLLILYPNTLFTWSALLITWTFPVGNCAKIHKRNCEGEFRKLNSPPCVCPDTNDQAGLYHSLLLLIRKVSRKLWGFQFDGVIILIFIFLPFDRRHDEAGIWSLKGRDN